MLKKVTITFDVSVEPDEVAVLEVSVYDLVSDTPLIVGGRSTLAQDVNVSIHDLMYGEFHWEDEEVNWEDTR